MSKPYSFVTRWRIVHPPQAVWDALNAPEEHHQWWPSMRAYRLLTPGISGVGSRAEREVRGRLPYSLRYVTTITRSEAPRELAYDSAGDLIGQGSTILSPTDFGTDVTIHWDVATSKAWMNLLAPVLRGLFAWNHNWVMDQGERGLNAWLSRTDRK